MNTFGKWFTLVCLDIISRYNTKGYSLSCISEQFYYTNTWKVLVKQRCSRADKIKRSNFFSFYFLFTFISLFILACMDMRVECASI